VFPEVLLQGESTPYLANAPLSAYGQVLLIGRLEPSQAVYKLSEFADSDAEMLQILFMAGEGEDVWDDIVCDCGRNFHSKLIETMHIIVASSSQLFEYTARYVLEMLNLPADQWMRKRVPVALLSSCSQELPANLAQLSFAQALQERLIEAAKDSSSFTLRRFSMVTIGQFRTISTKIIDVLASGCRDLGIVQTATLDAIGSFRRIDAHTLPKLLQMLSSSSAATVYAAAMVMREIANSHQAVREYGLRDSIAYSIAQAIRSVTFPKYIFIDGKEIGLLDDILFRTLVQVTSDNPQVILSEELLAESQLAFAGLREQSSRKLFGKGLELEQLKGMRDQAVDLQHSLAAQKMQIVEAGWKILITASQTIEEMEFGMPYRLLCRDAA
jgi:hypothetical protein